MTKNFDLFIEKLINSFEELPAIQPYGFWISPLGKIYSVGTMEHHIVAKNIIEHFEPNLKEIYENDPLKSFSEFLISKGFLRLNLEYDFCYIDNIYYPEGTTDTTKVKPTRIADTTAKDIAKYYNMEFKYLYK
jgi:hypothetical protein